MKLLFEGRYKSYFMNTTNITETKVYYCFAYTNKAKNRVFRTSRLGLLKNLTCWSNSEAGFDLYAKNYFGNDLQLFQNKTMQTCVMIWFIKLKIDILARAIPEPYFELAKSGYFLHWTIWTFTIHKFFLIEVESYNKYLFVQQLLRLLSPRIIFSSLKKHVLDQTDK